MRFKLRCMDSEQLWRDYAHGPVQHRRMVPLAYSLGSSRDVSSTRPAILLTAR